MGIWPRVRLPVSGYGCRVVQWPRVGHAPGGVPGAGSAVQGQCQVRAPHWGGRVHIRAWPNGHKGP